MMTQAMNHYQKQECSLFHVWENRTLCMRDCPHHKAFHTWHKEYLNSLRAWARRTGSPAPKEQLLKLATRVISHPEVTLSLEKGPTTRWVGPETLVDMILEGCKVLSLADSGSQVNMMTPEFVQEWGYPVLLLDRLVNYPLHLAGLGGQHTCPLGFVIVRLQVKEVAGYDENVVFLGSS